MIKNFKTITVDGVTINVTMLTHRYEVEILIPKEAIKKEIQIKHNLFSFHFYMKKACYGTVNIMLRRNYNRNKQGLVNIINYSKTEFNQENYSGIITLSPKLYVSGREMKKAKLEKERNRELSKLFKKCRPASGLQPKPTSSIYTNYKHNNAAKPYTGGKVSPK